MFNTLRSILIGRGLQAEAELETQNAALIIRQKISEAEEGHASAKRSLASLIVMIRSEEKALTVLDQQIADLTERTRQALDKSNEALAREAAVLLAQLEDERTLRRQTLETSQSKADRIRLAVERNHRQLIRLRQGLVTAQSIERERKAIAYINGPACRSVSGSIREGEAVLSRLLASDDPVMFDEVLDDLEGDLSGRSTLQRLSDTGYGRPVKTRPEDILNRLRADNATTDA